MTYALARTSRLKVGTGVAVLPGRHPVLVAKQLATLAGLAPRRVLPVFGLKPARPAELAAFPVPPGRRAAVFDESLTLIRLLLSQENVTFQGEFFAVEDASVGPAAGPAAGHLARRQRPGGAAARRAAGRRVAGQLPDPGRGGRRAPGHRGGRRRGGPRDRAGPLRHQPGRGRRRVAARAAAGRAAPPPGPGPGRTDPVRLGGRPRHGRATYVAEGLTKFVIRPSWTSVDPDRFTDGLRPRDGPAADLICVQLLPLREGASLARHRAARPE